RPLVRARLEVQPPARLRPRAAGGGHGAQRIPPAGADLHPRPAPLAALPPGRWLRLRPRLRRRPLPVLPRHRRRRRRRAGHPGLALRTGAGARARRPVRRPNPRGCRMSLLHALAKAGALRTLDHALAGSLHRLDPDTPDAVLAAAALASLAVSAGHAGFDPAEPQRLVEAPIDWPTPEAWRQALASSRWVACLQTGDAESAAAAAVVLQHGLVYLRRYRESERRLAEGLRRIGGIAPEPAGAERAEGQGAQVPAGLADLFAKLFPDAHSGEDLQAQAAAAALHHSLLLVTGGPGTGKTTTITRMLVLPVAQALQAGAAPPRIALAAPTGRAAERMAESVRNAVQALMDAGIDPALCAHLPTAGTTLHRLLGTIPDRPSFRHHADNPLPFDVVV